MEDTEKQIENAIFKYLGLQHPDLFAFKVETMGVFNPTTRSMRKAGKNVVLGTADIIACFKTSRGFGVFLAFEVKSSQGKQSENQKAFEQRLNAAGGFYFVVRSIVDVEEAMRRVKSYLKSMNLLEDITVSH